MSFVVKGGLGSKRTCGASARQIHPQMTALGTKHQFAAATRMAALVKRKVTGR